MPAGFGCSGGRAARWQVGRVLALVRRRRGIARKVGGRPRRASATASVRLASTSGDDAAAEAAACHRGIAPADLAVSTARSTVGHHHLEVISKSSRSHRASRRARRLAAGPARGSRGPGACRGVQDPLVLGHHVPDPAPLTSSSSRASATSRSVGRTPCRPARAVCWVQDQQLQPGGAKSSGTCSTAKLRQSKSRG